MSDKKLSVWIVEASWDQYLPKPAWHPTVGIALTRKDARKALTEWRQRNPDDRFRLRRYVAQGGTPRE